VPDHAVEAHPSAVFGREDLRNTASLEFGDFAGHDGSPTPSEDLHVRRPPPIEEFAHVFEELHVAALVGRHRDPLDVLLNRRVHDLVHRSVVAEVDDLDPEVLKQPTHEVDGRVVPVEERGGGDETDVVNGLVTGGRGGRRHGRSWATDRRSVARFREGRGSARPGRSTLRLPTRTRGKNETAGGEERSTVPSGKTNREEECEESNENNSPLLSSRKDTGSPKNGKNDRLDFFRRRADGRNRRRPKDITQYKSMT